MKDLCRVFEKRERCCWTKMRESVGCTEVREDEGHQICLKEIGRGC